MWDGAYTVGPHLLQRKRTEETRYGKQFAPSCETRRRTPPSNAAHDTVPYFSTYMYQVTRLVPSAVINSSFSLVSEFRTLSPTLCVILAGMGLNHGAKEQTPHGTDDDEVEVGIGANPFGEADDEPPPWCVSVSAPAAAPVSSPDIFFCSSFQIEEKQVCSAQIRFWVDFMPGSSKKRSGESRSAMSF
jgi:hypothetical protein